MSLRGSEQEQKLQTALTQAGEKNQADGYPQSECLFDLGVSCFEQNKWAEAEGYFKRAVEIKKSGQTKIMSADGYVPGNLPAYSNTAQERIGKTHDLANCLSWLGRSWEKQKKYSDAAAAYGQAITLLDTSKDPNHEAILFPDTLKRAAQIQRVLNHSEEAKKLDQRADFILKNRQLLDR